MKVTAVFDIGKTNKKFFLFDQGFNKIYQQQVELEQIEDEDGFPTENLLYLQQWMESTFSGVLQRKEWAIERLNFSTYGASLVYLGQEGQPLTHLYNYLKPFPADLYSSFFSEYGPEVSWSLKTASPFLGMLNSGLQLFWLKNRRSVIYAKTQSVLHFPQYCAFLFSGRKASEFTSIGCHTGLWDYSRNQYHSWVKEEGLLPKLPALKPATTNAPPQEKYGKTLIGTGIHDSSAALLPYLYYEREPFILLSTGTWCIALNPFSQDALTYEELQSDTLHYMRVDGRAVKAARLFLGHEYGIWVERLAEYFRTPVSMHKSVKPSAEILLGLSKYPEHTFKWESLSSTASGIPPTDLAQFPDYETAYHKLVAELAALQVEAIQRAKGTTLTKKLYVDGGFAQNELFLHLLKESIREVPVIVAQNPVGSALGAALVGHTCPIPPAVLAGNLGLDQ